VDIQRAENKAENDKSVAPSVASVIFWRTWGWFQMTRWEQPFIWVTVRHGEIK